MAHICLEFSIRSDYYNCDMLLFFLIFVYIKAILLLGAHNYYILIFLVNSSLEAMFVRKKTKNMHNKFLTSFNPHMLVSKYTSVIIPSQWNSQQLSVFTIIPNQQLVSWQNIFDRAIIYATMVLKNHQILFSFVASTSNERHPVTLVKSVQKVTDFAVMKNL